MTKILIEISPGELLDRITILELKADPDRIDDPDKNRRARNELDCLYGYMMSVEFKPVEVELLTETNSRIWDSEDKIRNPEIPEDEFALIAREIRNLNDQRAAIKRKIDERLGSPLAEVKSHRAC